MITNPCYCCSGLPFEHCCKPLVNEETHALHPEALMRSRFTAYHLGMVPYLLATWHPSTRPGKLELGEDDIQWTELQIFPLINELPLQNHGEVEFKAYYRLANHEGIHHEKSRFCREDDRWYYVDGQIFEPSNNVHNAQTSRNAACPCGSGNKFKRCCGK